MKKVFHARKRLKRKRIIPLFSIIFFICVIFNVLDKSKVELTDKTLVKILIKDVTKDRKPSMISKTKDFISYMYNNPTKFLLPTKSQLITQQLKPTVPTVNVDNNIQKTPLIYIYNTHQTEEYASNQILEYTIKPTVMASNYILEDVFNENNFLTYVEESKIKDILNQNNWKYSNSYKASRLLLTQRKKEYPSLKYFIDVHRDSVPKDKTTIVINDKAYAKILFIVGLDNPSFQENLAFTEKINGCLTKNYPNLSKGIYKKQGAGVNGIYNQDFSEYTILVEMGGYQNTLIEVMNSSLAFANCFMEVIANESKSIN